MNISLHMMNNLAFDLLFRLWNINVSWNLIRFDRPLFSLIFCFSASTFKMINYAEIEKASFVMHIELYVIRRMEHLLFDRNQQHNIQGKKSKQQQKMFSTPWTITKFTQCSKTHDTFILPRKFFFSYYFINSCIFITWTLFTCFQ